jgi:hypothetical protein
MQSEPEFSLKDWLWEVFPNYAGAIDLSDLAMNYLGEVACLRFLQYLLVLFAYCLHYCLRVASLALPIVCVYVLRLVLLVHFCVRVCVALLGMLPLLALFACLCCLRYLSSA